MTSSLGQLVPDVQPRKNTRVFTLFIGYSPGTRLYLKHCLFRNTHYHLVVERVSITELRCGLSMYPMHFYHTKVFSLPLYRFQYNLVASGFRKFPQFDSVALDVYYLTLASAVFLVCTANIFSH